MVSRLLILLMVVLTGACVTRAIKPLAVSEQLPIDLPKDLQERFAIKDVGAPTERTPTAAVVPEKAKKSRRGKSAVKVAEAKAKTPIALEYPNRKPEKDSIWVAERMVFDISYFGLHAGTFSLEVMPPKVIGNRTVLPIKGRAASSAVFSLAYRIDDYIESYFDYFGAFSHRLHVVLDESKQKRDALELFDSEKKQTYYWNRIERTGSPMSETKTAAEIAAFSQDSLTSLYYLRSIPLEVGKVVTFPVVSEGKSIEAICTVVKKESMSSPFGYVNTFVIRPQMKVDGEIKNKEDSYLWMTDDERRIPIKLEAKVKVGTVVARLHKFEFGNPPAQGMSSVNDPARQPAADSDKSK